MIKKSLIVTILCSFGLFYSNVFSQDTLFVFPSAKNVDVVVDGEVKSSDGNYLYNYNINSSEDSDQDIFQFFVETYSELNQINSPQNWRGRISDARKRIIFWSTRDSAYYIHPSEELGGFNFISNLPPSMVNFYIRGRFDRPSFPEGEAPPLESIEGADIFENSVRGKTIGPKDPPDPFIPEAFLDSLVNYKDQSCDLGWIENQGICRSLEANLNNIKRQLEQGRNQTAANNLRAFLNEVEAIREEQLSPEAYSLLRFNGEYLLEKLRED